MITLKSSTGEIFEVDEAVAFQSQTIKILFGDSGADTVIPLLEVTGPVLAKVIEYCENHVNQNNADELELWDEDFVQGLNKAMLFDLVVVSSLFTLSFFLSSYFILVLLAYCIFWWIDLIFVRIFE